MLQISPSFVVIYFELSQNCPMGVFGISRQIVEPVRLRVKLRRTLDFTRPRHARAKSVAEAVRFELTEELPPR